MQKHDSTKSVPFASGNLAYRWECEMLALLLSISMKRAVKVLVEVYETVCIKIVNVATV
jgi:hypothetical protein